MFSSDKIDKHEYLKSEEMLPTDQNRLMIQAEFTHYLLIFFIIWKSIRKKKKLLKSMEKKQAKVNKHQREKQFQALQPLMFFEKELLFVTDYISN